ncbi:DNAJ heat shock N-terminal domain-containing protein [Gaertneriomyces semiglobifer]|nr:DNAJ heat shock N-terminal domain-containing protein [Gaertneriomyces semiglobifer]
MVKRSHYEVLGVSNDASLEVIKRRYKELALQHHPDKVSEKAESSSTPSSVAFQRISLAYSTLKDPQTRIKYDEQLRSKQTASGPVHEQVDLDDMKYDESSATFSYGCRCGGEYLVTEDDLSSGVQMVGCDSCSLTIHVLYEAAISEDEAS